MTRYSERVRRLEEARSAQLKSIVEFMMKGTVEVINRHVSDRDVRLDILRDLLEHSSKALGADSAGPGRDG